MAHRTRLRDIADAAGVDVSVVSRVLNNKGVVRVETRRRVLEIAQALNYRPNPAAQMLRAAKTLTVALLLPDLSNVAYAEIAAGAEQRALAAGYLLIIASGSVAERMAMLDGRVDGVLIASATSDLSWQLPPRGAMPVLLVNRRETTLGIPSITVNDQRGLALAVEHLISLGHTRIGHIAGPQNTDTARRRLEGFTEAMRAAGLELKDELISEAPYSEAGGYSAAMNLLRLREPPTGVVASTVTVAIGVGAAARQLGFAMPNRLSLVGYDDVKLAQYLDPPLTTVRMPLREMGAEAVSLLLAMMNGRAVEDVVLDLPPELVVRSSTAPPLAVR